MQITCFVLGNCQGQFISSARASLPGWETYAVGRRFGFDPKVGSHKPQYAPLKDFWPLVQETKKAGRYCIVLEQVTSLASLKDYGVHEDLIDKKILFPHVQAQAFWPDRWFPPELVSVTKFSRLLAQDLAGIKRAQLKTNFPVNVRGFVESKIFTECLFHTWGHSSAPLIGVILDGIVAHLDGIVTAKHRDILKTSTASSAGIDNITNHPVDREWLRSGGIKWGDDKVYSSWSEATILYKSEQFSSAIGKARESLAADDSNPYVWTLPAQGLERQKDMIGAEEAYQNAVTLHPTAPGLRGALGRFLLKNGMPRRAAQFAKTSCEIFPADTPSYLLAAEAHFALNEHEAARAFIAVGAERGHPHPPTLLRMLELMISAGMKDEARPIWQSMVKRVPRHAELRAVFELSNEMRTDATSSGNALPSEE